MNLNKILKKIASVLKSKLSALMNIFILVISWQLIQAKLKCMYLTFIGLFYRPLM